MLTGGPRRPLTEDLEPPTGRTYVIPPHDVREADDAQFWIVQGGSMAAFRVLPNTVAKTRTIGLPTRWRA